MPLRVGASLTTLTTEASNPPSRSTEEAVEGMLVEDMSDSDVLLTVSGSVVILGALKNIRLELTPFARRGPTIYLDLFTSSVWSSEGGSALLDQLRMSGFCRSSIMEMGFPQSSYGQSLVSFTHTQIYLRSLGTGARPPRYQRLP